MKKILLMMGVIIFAAGAGRAQNTAPYTPTYSSHFMTADESYANKVLEILKGFEDNHLGGHKNWFSDTVRMEFANGQTTRGYDETLARSSSFRSSVQNLKLTINAWMSLKSDKGDNLVCVWAKEEYTDGGGKHTVNQLQEVWGFNKDGKIDMMLQYVRTPAAM